jgi:hypothetical protein
MAMIIIFGGGFYGHKLPAVEKLTVQEIVDKLVKKGDSAENDLGKRLITELETDPKKKEEALKSYKTMKACLLEFPPLLRTDGVLANKRRDNTTDFIYSDLDEIIGKKFRDEVYHYMSKGLISPTFLESLSN